MEELLKRIAEAQENQATEWKIVKEELADIRDSMNRMHGKLDDTIEKTIVNTEKIKYIKEQFEAEKFSTEKQLNIIHESIRRRDGHIKWIVSAIIIPVAISILAFFKNT